MSPGNADHALDVRFRGVERKPEDHHVAALDAAEAEVVGELVDEDAFLIGQRRHHAGAFHFDRLVDEDNQDDRDQDREGQVAHPGKRIPHAGRYQSDRRGAPPELEARKWAVRSLASLFYYVIIDAFHPALVASGRLLQQDASNRKGDRAFLESAVVELRQAVGSRPWTACTRRGP